LTEEDIVRLHTRYVTERDAQSLAKVQEQLQTLLDEIARRRRRRVARRAISAEISRPASDSSRDRPRVGSKKSWPSLVSMAGAMQSATHALSSKLEASAKEVDSLTDQLGRAQIEALRRSADGP